MLLARKVAFACSVGYFEPELFVDVLGYFFLLFFQKSAGSRAVTVDFMPKLYSSLHSLLNHDHRNFGSVESTIHNDANSQVLEFTSNQRTFVMPLERR
jgi:hypothetical protein